MTEEREIIGHARHANQGPHLAVPPGFTPLRLRVATPGKEVEIVCPVAIVGRHTDVDLRIAYPDVSRRHCEFVFEAGVWRVHDLNSLNGVYINNMRTIEGPLYAGDEIRIGNATMLVLAGTPIPGDDENEKLRQIADALPSE